MEKLKEFKTIWIARLKDKKLAVEYLNAALEEGDHRIFLLALREVAEAQGGFLKLSNETRLDRSNLYKMLSKKGHTEIQTLEKVLAAFGLEFRVSLKSSHNLKKAA